MAVDPATLALIAQAAPSGWEIGKNIATEVGSWFGKGPKAAEKRQQTAVDQLIGNFMKNPGSQFVNPQLLKEAQRLAGGGWVGESRDPQLQNLARSWVKGEGGVRYDTNLGNQLLRGDIPPSVAAAMDRQLGTRFDRLRRDQGGQLARSGVLRSSAGGRLMADTYDSQRNALADAYMNTLLQRQQLGLGVLNSADASRRAYTAMGASELGRQRDLDLAYRQLGFNVLSDADRRKFGRETFGINARLAQLGQQQARRDASLESAGNILSNLYTNYQDQQRFDKLLSQQGDQFSQLLNLQGGGGKISPIQAKANLSAVQLGGGNILGSRDPFKLLSEQRTGAGGYGARNTPLTSRY